VKRNSCSRKLNLDDLENLEQFEDVKSIQAMKNLDQQNLTLTHEDAVLKTSLNKSKACLDERTTINAQKNPMETTPCEKDRITHQIGSFNPELTLNADTLSTG
jgi:hypothetical protein